MGEAERVTMEGLSDLMRLAANLSPARRAELVDFAAFLAAREAQGEQESARTDEDRAWLDAAAADLGDRLTEIEAGVPPEEVASWLAKLSEGAVPVWYNPETGELEEVRP